MIFNPSMTCTAMSSTIAVQPSTGTHNCATPMTSSDNFGTMVR